MEAEDKNREYKSILKAIGEKSDVEKLAETCVAFANAQGGELIIGIENKTLEPPSHQKIEIEEMNKVVSRLRSLTDGVGLVNPEIKTHKNGGEYFVINVQPSTRTIATTTSGKVFIRFSDKSFAVGSEELTNLAAEKAAFQWEIVDFKKITLEQVNKESSEKFIADIKASEKVSTFIKNKDAFEIFQFYQIVNLQGSLTNLGILWLGTPMQRARLSYPLTVQYIVYNDKGEKVRKKEWHFHLHSPKELLLEIEREAVELNYSIEIPNGLFRKTIRKYSKEVIRELLINAIAHKKYTISGDIFIEVFSDRMTITNPGSLPLGITKDNILHERQRRNPHLILTLHDLSLMEGEGSGYDLVFEKLARDAKPMPEIISNFTNVSVTIYAGEINTEVISILDYIDNYFQLTQKEFITLGLIAINKKILSTQLANKLQLQQEDKMRFWIGTLIDKEIVIARGIKKGTEYLLNPDLFASANLNIKPTLKTVEPFQIEMLIVEYLKHNGSKSLKDIQNKLQEISKGEIQKVVYKMTKEDSLKREGGNKNSTYFIPKKNK